MNNSIHKIAFGGGCHWCTEAVFQALKGVTLVAQGWIASTGTNNSFSEGVIVHYNPAAVTIKKLIEVHLHTHKSTSNHSMRKKYRSAVYTFSKKDADVSNVVIDQFQMEFNNQIITKVYPFEAFKSSPKEIENYYFRNPSKPFCKKYIDPKLQVLSSKFSEIIKG
jgi:peptide-methionine (S)-S-oxide reductase